MLTYLWNFQKSGGLFLIAALLFNLGFYLLTFSKKPKGSPSFLIHVYFASSSLWILVNIPFAFSTSPSLLTPLANIAYIATLLTSWSLVRIIHIVHERKTPRYFSTFSILILLLTVLVKGPIKTVIIRNPGFLLVPKPLIGPFLNFMYLFYTLFFLYSSYKIMITRGNTRLFIIAATYLLLLVAINLIGSVSTGNGLWWLGPSFVIIFSSFVHYLIVYRSGYSLSFYVSFLFAILIYGIIGGILAERIILRYMDKPAAYIFLGLWSIILTLFLNFRNQGLTITPYPRLINTLQYLQKSFGTLTLKHKTHSTQILINILELLLNLKGSLGILITFKGLNKKLVILGDKAQPATVNSLKLLSASYKHLIYVFKPEGLPGEIRIYSRKPKEITIELKRYLDYVLSTMFIIYYLTLSQEQLRNFNQRLEQTVKLRTQELAEANLKLKQTLAKLETMYQAVKESDEAKTMFISIASHQLRTPISIVKNYVDMILSGAAGPLTAEQQKFLLRIRQAMTRLANLITDILQSSRLERGKFKLVISTVSLASLVQEVFEQYKDLAARKRLEYKLEITSDVKNLTIQCDKDKLFEAFGNLIDNAIHYTQQGYVHVYLYQPNPQWVIYAVKDTGIGIPKNKIHQLFKKFVRLENARRVRPDGTGIGLYLVKRIVESHGGRVWVESEVGKGSTFYIALPTKLPEWVLKNATQINT